MSRSLSAPAHAGTGHIRPSSQLSLLQRPPVRMMGWSLRCTQRLPSRARYAPMPTVLPLTSVMVKPSRKALQRGWGGGGVRGRLVQWQAVMATCGWTGGRCGGGRLQQRRSLARPGSSKDDRVSFPAHLQKVVPMAALPDRHSTPSPSSLPITSLSTQRTSPPTCRGSVGAGGSGQLL